MDRLIVLGTGNANATRCYNTCFALDLGDELLLCDAGGGNGILRQLQDAGIGLNRIHHLIVTHAHTDHVMGVVWLMRMIAAQMNAGKYEGELRIYASAAVREGLTHMANFMLQPKMIAQIGKRILFCDIADGQTETIAGRETVFFDIGSTKARQYGISLRLPDGQRFTCLGD
jgi:ribonuclease Z